MNYRAVDLFCCAGGASDGLTRAGFDVKGVDREDQPEYPYPLWPIDVTVMGNPDHLRWLRAHALIWASPPCQHFTAYKRRPGHVAPAAEWLGLQARAHIMTQRRAA